MLPADGWEKAYLTKKGETKNISEHAFSQEHQWRTRLSATITSQSYSTGGHVADQKGKIIKSTAEE